MDSSQTWGRQITFEVDKTVSAMYLYHVLGGCLMIGQSHPVDEISYWRRKYTPHDEILILAEKGYLSLILTIHTIHRATSIIQRVGTPLTSNGHPGPIKISGLFLLYFLLAAVLRVVKFEGVGVEFTSSVEKCD